MKTKKVIKGFMVGLKLAFKINFWVGYSAMALISYLATRMIDVYLSIFSLALWFLGFIFIKSVFKYYAKKSQENEKGQIQ